MHSLSLLLLSTLIPALVPCSVTAAEEQSPLEEARARLEEGHSEQAVTLLQSALMRGQASFEVNSLLGKALLELERIDEAAHYLEQALTVSPSKKQAKALRRLLRKADPHFERREGFFENVTERLGQIARELAEEGHAERALDLAVRLEPLAHESALRDLQDLLVELRSARTAVDLDAAATDSEARQPSDEQPLGEWPLHEYESEHYIVRANLEPEVAELVASTMDDIFGYYVQIYFEGDQGRIQKRKASIRIHPSSEKMLENWAGDSTPGGWWSPGEWTVVCYDTRTTSQSLDGMLETLFHEASHQFMTMRERGGSSPAWLNEGTATFFEGAQAMADGRVLWPQAARGRLRSLSRMLQSGAGPTLADVVGYSAPASYEPDYYPFGWGLVYFLQQYEDPQTLEYIYRDQYQAYMQAITTRALNTRELFDELFVGSASPQGFANFAEFETFWRSWILDSVLPLYSGSLREERRLALVERYLEAAGPATSRAKKGAERARIEELLMRALGHVEYLREEFHGGTNSEPDGALLERSIELLERLDRTAAAAPAIESLLELVDHGLWELDADRYERYSERLNELDSKNAALRKARSKSASLTKSARRLFEAYSKDDKGFVLRTYTFARLAGLALDDESEGGLLELSLELRERARAADLLLGSIHAVTGPEASWMTIFDDAANTLAFETQPERVLIEGVRPVARICQAVPVRGEYRLRATVRRAAPLRRATVQGLVVSGTPDGDWIVVGLSGRGELSVRRMEFGAGGGVLDRPLRAPALEPPVPDDEHPLISVHAYPEGRLSITIGERAPVEMQLDAALPATAFAGLYAKDGKTELLGLSVEIYP